MSSTISGMPQPVPDDPRRPKNLSKSWAITARWVVPARLSALRWRRGATGAAGLAVVSLFAIGLLFGADDDIIGLIWIPATVAVGFTPLAIFVLRRFPGHPVGLIMLAAGGSATLDCLACCWSSWTPAAWVAQWLWWPPFGLILIAVLRFPDGRIPSPGWRPLSILVIMTTAATSAALASAALFAPRTLVVGGSVALPSPARTLAMVAIVLIGLTVLATVPVGIGLARRGRTAPPLERRQIACLLPSALLLAVGIPLSVINIPGAWVPAVLALPIGFTFAVLQYRLLDLDLVIHRGLIWLLMGVSMIAIYSLTVAGLSQAAGLGRSWQVSLVAGAAAAIGLMPAERFAQRAASRMLFGRRDDPYAVLVTMGRHIKAIHDPLDVLPRLAETLVESLRVPYAAVELTVSDSPEPVVVDYGRPPLEACQRFPMMAHGLEVGALLVASRRPESQFSASEVRLLDGLAAQAATAAEACRSSLDLQRARERLVMAREEERRRLRHDLHDGVASTLVGARLLTRAALGVEAQGRPTREILTALDVDLANCSTEVRTLIDGLRPAVLDHGLESAIRLALGAASTYFDTRLEISGSLADLPAAIEVVALRVVSEAVTNVIKHSEATCCAVAVHRGSTMLNVRVVDDGVGLPDPTPVSTDAVGLLSMRSRVEEIGGWLRLRPAVPTGLVLEACLPTPHLIVEDTGTNIGSDGPTRTASQE